jgi:nitroreductase
VDALEALRSRRSIRRYEEQPVDHELIEEIVDCARCAPSARNVQPWEFVVVTDAAMRRQLADATDFGKHIAAAPVCIAVLVRDTKYCIEDGAAATENLLIAARAVGLGSCWIAGARKIYAEPVRAMLGAPPGYRLMSLVTLGYPAEKTEVDKRPLEAVLHWEKF